eukprot:m.1617509 g.1617509  ORF g.1617509 m.1617509 type:complete len:2403 (+) comp25373_c0_seq3:356-7564(+)
MALFLACLLATSAVAVSSGSWYHSILTIDGTGTNSPTYNTSAFPGVIVHVQRFNDTTLTAHVHMSWSGLFSTPKMFGLRRREFGGVNGSADVVVNASINHQGDNIATASVLWPDVVWTSLDEFHVSSYTSATLEFFVSTSAGAGGDAGTSNVLTMAGVIVRVADSFNMSALFMSGIAKGGHYRSTSVPALSTATFGVMHVYPSADAHGEWEYMFHGVAAPGKNMSMDIQAAGTPIQGLTTVPLSNGTVTHVGGIEYSHYVVYGTFALPMRGNSTVQASDISIRIRTDEILEGGFNHTLLAETSLSYAPALTVGTTVDESLNFTLRLDAHGTLCISVHSGTPCGDYAVILTVGSSSLASEGALRTRMVLPSSSRFEGCLAAPVFIPQARMLHANDVGFSTEHSVGDTAVERRDVWTSTVPTIATHRVEYALPVSRVGVLLAPAETTAAGAAVAVGSMCFEARGEADGHNPVSWFFRSHWASNTPQAPDAAEVTVVLNGSRLHRMIPRSVRSTAGTAAASTATLHGFTTVPSSMRLLTTGTAVVSLETRSGPFVQGVPYHPRVAGTNWVHLAHSVLQAVLVPRTSVAIAGHSGGVLTVLATVPAEADYNGTVAAPGTSGVHVHLALVELRDLAVTGARVEITSGGHVVCAFGLESTYGDHVCPPAVSVATLLGATVTVAFTGSTEYDVQGVITASPTDYVAVLGPAADGRDGDGAVALASAHMAPDATISMDVEVSGLTSAPLGNSELVLGPMDAATVTPVYDGDRRAVRPLQFSSTMPRPSFPAVRHPASEVPGSSSLRAVGVVADGARVALSDVLALGGSGGLGNVGVLGTVVVRTASGVACVGVLERVGPAHGVFLTTWADSTTTGLLNDVLPVTANGTTLVTGAVMTMVNTDVGVVSFHLRIRWADVLACTRTRAILSVEGTDVSLMHANASTTGMHTDGTWVLPHASDVSDTLHARVALASGKVRMRITPHSTTEVEDSLAQGAVNAGLFYDPSPTQVLMAETALPGTILFENDPLRPFAYVVNASSLLYSTDSALFGVMNASTGAVGVLDAGFTFNYNVQSEFSVDMTVEDVASGRIDTTRVGVALVDVNNMPPTFAQRVYDAEVYEGAPVGTIVAQIQAIDGDPTFRVLSYSWVESAQPDISSPDGLFAVTTAVVLDDTGTAVYVARITTTGRITRAALGPRINVLLGATDGVNGQAVAVVAIAVTDINDAAPVFALPPPASRASDCRDNVTTCKLRRGPTVPEDVASDVVLYAFSASDADFGANGDVVFAVTASQTYGLPCGSSAGLFAVADRGSGTGERGNFTGVLTVHPDRTLDFETQREYDVCVLASDLGTPPRHDIIRVTISVTNVPFRMEPIRSTNLAGTPTAVLFTNGAFSMTVADNREDAVVVAQMHLRANAVAPRDCTLTPWVAGSTCAVPAGGALPTDWAGRFCRQDSATATGTLSQTRTFVSLRDARGYGGDCPRIAGPLPPGQPPRTTGLVTGDIELERQVTCGQELCPTRHCTLATNATTGETWLVLRSCTAPVQPCMRAYGLEAQVVTALPSPLECGDDPDVTDIDACSNVVRFPGRPCMRSGFLAGVNLSQAFIGGDDSNWTMHASLRSFLDSPIPTPALMTQWGANLTAAQPGAIVNLRTTECMSVCASPIPTAAPTATPTATPTLGVSPVPQINTSAALVASALAPRNGYVRNHPLYDTWQVDGQWVRRAFWYGQAQPTGEWNARRFEERFGVHGTWLPCQEANETGAGGTTGTPPEDEFPTRHGASCTFDTRALPEGNNTVAFRALAPSGTDVGEVTYVIVMDTDTPLAFLARCPFASATAASVLCAPDGSGTRRDGSVPVTSRSRRLEVTLTHRDSDTRLCDLPVCASPVDIADGCHPCQQGSPVTFLCRLDGDAWDAFHPCPLSSTQPPAGDNMVTVAVDDLADGAHTLEIACSDAAGNGYVAGGDTAPTADVVLSWVVDTVSPQGFLRTWPRQRVTGNTSAAFSIMSDTNATTFTCALDGAVQPCTAAPSHSMSGAAVVYHELSHGLHTFNAVATDTAGNADAATAPTFTWFVDTHPPVVHFDRVSDAVDYFPYGSVSNRGDMTLEFSADEPTTRFRCQLSVLEFAERTTCCTTAFATVLPECVPPCTSNASDVPPSCVGTSNVSLLARRTYAGCVEAAVRMRYTTLSTDAAGDSGPWEDCASPYTLTNLGAAHAYWVHVAAMDMYANDGSSSAGIKVQPSAQWFWAVDPMYIDSATVTRQLALNRQPPTAAGCSGVSQALVAVCILTWGLLGLLLGAMACARHRDRTRTVLTFDDEQLSYTDAIKIMRDTTVDLAVEPGFHDTFGRGVDASVDEVDTDAATVRYGGGIPAASIPQRRVPPPTHVGDDDETPMGFGDMADFSQSEDDEDDNITHSV